MVANKYQLLREKRSAKFRAIVAAMGFGAAARLHKITGISVANVRASSNPNCPWTDAKTRRFETLLGLPKGWFDDGEPVPPYGTPVLDSAGLRAWLAASAAIPVVDDSIPLLRVSELATVFWGDRPAKRVLPRDVTLPATGRLIAVECPEDCAAPLIAGDIAIFLADGTPVLGVPVLAFIPRHGFTIRRFRVRHTASSDVIELAATAADFKSFKIGRPEDGQIVGVLVQLRRPFI